ncbi:uncharacterized protein CLAFUR5_08875 [Fulvia fulva]|uniref:Uncharacterized protein n=1 Tax=Passalora fulva TaxID=5499 RepID=A0A9Q8UT50_PASFU|nr:uncharacterized protein CLAFUR5_08875 [Fulvia fulva]UJO21447.1 hypothetical protein CLAFUR5_08875 [Fulvia fulva]
MLDDLINVRRLHKPKCFSQAVGRSQLYIKGDMEIVFKNQFGQKQTFMARNVLYSLDADATLISAELMFKDHGIYIDRPSNTLLQKGKPVGLLTIVKNVTVLRNFRIRRAPKSKINRSKLRGLAALAFAKPRADNVRWH